VFDGRSGVTVTTENGHSTDLPRKDAIRCVLLWSLGLGILYPTVVTFAREGAVGVGAFFRGETHWGSWLARLVQGAVVGYCYALIMWRFFWSKAQNKQAGGAPAEAKGAVEQEIGPGGRAPG
jgi:hypothetical protein